MLMLHCKACLEEIADGSAGTKSPQEYARIEVCVENGFVRVACVRHTKMIVSIAVDPNDAILGLLKEQGCQSCKDKHDSRMN